MDVSEITKIFKIIFLFIYSALTIERRTEDYTYLHYSDGVRFKWDDSMTIYVTVEQTYMKQVTGLCGTYTNKRDGKRYNFDFPCFF
jgi:hypothetical protein